MTVELPSPLREYFSALNEADVPRALRCVSPTAVVTLEAYEPAPTEITAIADGGQVPDGDHDGVSGWLERAMLAGTLVITPLVVEIDGSDVAVEVSVTVFPRDASVVRTLQRAIYTIESGLITRIRTEPLRAPRVIPPRDDHG